MGIPGSRNVVGIFRVVRLIRMFRVFEIFPDLRVMLYSVAASATSIWWALVLMIFFLWACACYFMEIAALYFPSLDSAHQEQIQEHWNGMLSSFKSLTYSVTGGWDWGDLA